MLIDNSNCGLIISLVNLIDASSHDDKALSLRYELIDVSIWIGILDLSLMELVALDLEVAHSDLLRVIFTTLSQHKVFGILFQFRLDVIEDTIQERLLATIHRVDLTIEILNNFESDVSPLGSIAWILVIIEQLLEEFVTHSFILAVVVDLNFEFDETKSLVLKNIKEDVIVLEVIQLFCQSLYSVARVEDIQLFLALFSRLRLNHTILVDMLLEALPNFRTRLQLYGRIRAHFLDNIKRLSLSGHEFFGHFSWTCVLWLRRFVQLFLVFSDVLNELDRVEKTLLGKDIESILTGCKHEILLWNW